MFAGFWKVPDGGALRLGWWGGTRVPSVGLVKPVFPLVSFEFLGGGKRDTANPAWVGGLYDLASGGRNRGKGKRGDLCRAGFVRRGETNPGEIEFLAGRPLEGGGETPKGEDGAAGSLPKMEGKRNDTPWLRKKNT